MYHLATATVHIIAERRTDRQHYHANGRSHCECSRIG